MNEENFVSAFNEEQREYVLDLLNKANQVNEKTNPNANVDLYFPQIGDAVSCPIRVDDIKLLYIGARLLPNMANYLVNILPQFLYPYLVAYLQELSTVDRPITINELYDLVLDLDKID